MLYFMAKDLYKVEPHYQFSLKWFVRIYKSELKNKEGINPTSDTMEDLCMRLTKAIYQKICLGVYQKHKLMVSFLIAFNLMK